MTDDLVLSVLDGAVARLTLNDGDHANVLSQAMMSALSDAIAAANADPRVRVIVLGAAGRIFCAGHDLAELRADDDNLSHEILFELCSELMMSIGDGRAPVIVKVQGAAVAAGCQLVASCDLAFAADSAKFAVSGVNLGLFCSTPGVALGRAVGRKAAADLLLTGRFIDAARAAELGLVNQAVAAAELDRVVDRTAALIAEKPPEAIAIGKATFRRQIEQPLEMAYNIASKAMAENLRYESAKAGIDAFLKK